LQESGRTTGVNFGAEDVTFILEGNGELWLFFRTNHIIIVDITHLSEICHPYCSSAPGTMSGA
jgi:hypothetical protein